MLSPCHLTLTPTAEPTQENCGFQETVSQHAGSRGTPVLTLGVPVCRQAILLEVDTAFSLRFTTDERTLASLHSDAVALRCLWSSGKTHSSCLCPAPVTLLVRTRLLHAPGRAHTEVSPTVAGLSEVPDDT